MTNFSRFLTRAMGGYFLTMALLTSAAFSETPSQPLQTASGDAQVSKASDLSVELLRSQVAAIQARVDKVNTDLANLQQVQETAATTHKTLSDRFKALLPVPPPPAPPAPGVEDAAEAAHYDFRIATRTPGVKDAAEGETEAKTATEKAAKANAGAAAKTEERAKARAAKGRAAAKAEPPAKAKAAGEEAADNPPPVCQTPADLECKPEHLFDKKLLNELIDKMLSATSSSVDGVLAVDEIRSLGLSVARIAASAFTTKSALDDVPNRAKVLSDLSDTVKDLIVEVEALVDLATTLDEIALQQSLGVIEQSLHSIIDEPSGSICAFKKSSTTTSCALQNLGNEAAAAALTVIDELNKLVLDAAFGRIAIAAISDLPPVNPQVTGQKIAGLDKGLQSPDSVVRSIAANGIGALGKRARSEMKEVVLDPSQDGLVRRAMIRSFSRLVAEAAGKSDAATLGLLIADLRGIIDDLAVSDPTSRAIRQTAVQAISVAMRALAG